MKRQWNPPVYVPPPYYPATMHGGYGVLFEPALPERIGSPLMIHIMKGCRTKDPEELRTAIDILSKQHTKAVHHKTGAFDHHTQCKPTPVADQVIKELQVIIQQIEDEKGPQLL